MSNEIGMVLSDFAKMYQLFEGFDNYNEALYDLNGGWCGVTASACLYILRAKYGMNNLKFRSHSLHMWIGDGNRDYDTLFPEGYSRPVPVVWMLKEIGYSEQITEVGSGEEANKGFWDWGFLYLFKAMCERWGVPLPDYYQEYVDGAERMTTTAAVRERRTLMESRYHKLVKTPLIKRVATNDVYPYTHYEISADELNQSRKLRAKPF